MKETYKANLFIVECLTNLHVGTGDVNFNIVDQEVVKDISGYPIIHASGVKGAFRDAYKGENSERDKIFGKSGENNTNIPGAYKFFDAKFLSRPLRVGLNAQCAYILTTTIPAINEYIEALNAFGIHTDLKKIEIEFPNDVEFLVCGDICNIEGSTAIASVEDFLDSSQIDNLKQLIGNNFAIVCDINEYDLPIIARNKLDELGKSDNLWYEEYVPHHSKFWLIVLSPNGEFVLDIDSPIQFGGNASVGFGYARVTKM